MWGCPPKLDGTLRDLYGAGEAPNNLHNNCSGKHAGMLNTALHMGEPTKGYIGLIHPVQKRITEALTEMMEAIFPRHQLELMAVEFPFLECL